MKIEKGNLINNSDEKDVCYVLVDDCDIKTPHVEHLELEAGEKICLTDLQEMPNYNDRLELYSGMCNIGLIGLLATIYKDKIVVEP